VNYRRYPVKDFAAPVEQAYRQLHSRLQTPRCPIETTRQQSFLKVKSNDPVDWCFGDSL